MGLCGSRPSPVADALTTKYPRTFEALFIKNDADKWIQKFEELDTGGKGRIRTNALLALCDTPSTPFTEKIFHFMDTDNTGYQDIRGFAFSTWNICTMDRNGLSAFVYDMYGAEDVRFDSSGMRAILGDVHIGTRSGMESNEIVTLKKVIDRLPPERHLSQTEFVGFAHRYNVFLAPLFKMVNNIKAEMFGTRYWRNLEGKRRDSQNKLYRPQYWAQLQARCYSADNQGGAR